MRRTWTSKWSQGQKAPDFYATTHDAIELHNSSLHGKKYILFFYNHDGSETCTKQACHMRDHFQQLSKLGYTIIGVSEDSIKTHQKFAFKHNLPFPLISDVDNELAKRFDIYGQKEFMGRKSDAVHRTTFVIDENGIIESVIHPVDSKNHVRQILESLNIQM